MDHKLLLAIATAASGRGTFGEESPLHPGMLFLSAPMDLAGWRMNRRALIATGALWQAFLTNSDVGLDSIVFQAPTGSTTRGPETKLSSDFSQPIRLLFAGKVHQHSLGAPGSFKPGLCCPLPAMPDMPDATFIVAPAAQMCSMTSDMRVLAWLVRCIPKDSDEIPTLVPVYAPLQLPEVSGMSATMILVAHLVPNPQAMTDTAEGDSPLPCAS